MKIYFNSDKRVGKAFVKQFGKSVFYMKANITIKCLSIFWRKKITTKTINCRKFSPGLFLSLKNEKVNLSQEKLSIK